MSLRNFQLNNHRETNAEILAQADHNKCSGGVAGGKRMVYKTPGYIWGGILDHLKLEWASQNIFLEVIGWQRAF